MILKGILAFSVPYFFNPFWTSIRVKIEFSQFKNLEFQYRAKEKGGENRRRDKKGNS